MNQTVAAKETLSNFERQEAIVRYLEGRQRATVAEIAAHFAVSLATMRRDLETLDAEGRIERFHGGAKAVRKAPPELPILHRTPEQAEEKARIGLAAAALVQDGETLFLGSGTTVLEVAKQLHDRQQLTVITNSLLVLNELARSPHITVIGLGGMLRHTEMSLIGHLTEQTLAEVRAQKIILGVRAIDVEHGLTNHYVPETMTDRAILAQGGEVIVVADHTKCKRISTVLLAPITVIQKLVTDAKAPLDFVAALRKQGVDVVVV